jgi:hypothetical protein
MNAYAIWSKAVFGWCVLGIILIYGEVTPQDGVIFVLLHLQISNMKEVDNMR